MDGFEGDVIMANYGKKSPPKPLVMQPSKQALLNGPVLRLIPVFVNEFGGLAEGLVFTQILYLADNKFNDEAKIVRKSFNGLRKQIPFYTRRWLIEIIKRLEKKGIIAIHRTLGVNQYTPTSFTVYHQHDKKSLCVMLVFPQLACKVGLNEAIVLQQIHIRHHQMSNTGFIFKTMKQWHEDVFTFYSEITVKRIFKKLKDNNLILVKNVPTDTGVEKGYRVNYLKIAEILDIEYQEPDKSELNKKALK
jgi:hypothetical protein